MKKINQHLIGFAAGALVVCAAGMEANAAVITFQDGLNGYDGTRDSMLWNREDNGRTRTQQTNYGQYGMLVAGHGGLNRSGNHNTDARSSVISFDDILGTGAGHPQIGPNISTINSATLRFHVNGQFIGNPVFGPAVFRRVRSDARMGCPGNESVFDGLSVLRSGSAGGDRLVRIRVCAAPV